MSDARSSLFIFLVVGANLLMPMATASQRTGADLVAIDVLLQPDASMIERAKVDNALLKQNYPGGFALDGSHSPRITLLRRFVRARDIKAISQAVAKVVQTTHLSDVSLSATGYVYRRWNGIGVLALVVEVSPESQSFERRIVEIVQSFAVSGGTPEAYAHTAGDASFNKESVFVQTYVPRTSGKKFITYVPVGVAPMTFVKDLAAKQFNTFSFGTQGIAIHQVGLSGAAEKKLWEWKGQ